MYSVFYQRSYILKWYTVFMVRRTYVIVDTLLLIILFIAFVLAYVFRYDLQDAWALRNYHPDATIQSLAGQATLTPLGQRLFYRNDPKIYADRQSLARDCRIKSDTTIELGCYLSTQHIYLLDVAPPELRQEMAVTVAHETLHAAYDRLSASQKKQLDTQLQAAADALNDKKLNDRLALYDKLEPGEHSNELHSILGTEYANLSPQLETYFGKYLTNRSAVVAYNTEFNRTFDGLHDEIVQLNDQITKQKAKMNADLAAGRIATYNSQVGSVNANITSYNLKVDKYNRYANILLGQQPAQPSQ